MRKFSIPRYFKYNPGKNKKESLLHFLDSLGYFNPRLDTIGIDTIEVDIGVRSSIDTIIIRCDIPISIDSIRNVNFPIFYDAGVVQKLAFETLSFLSHQGFPFAKLSIVISDSMPLKTIADVLETKSIDKHIIIIFNINTQKRCVFDEPIFSGEFKTREDIFKKDIAFKKGQIYDIEKVETSRKRLASRNYISEVYTGAPAIISHEPVDSTDISAAKQNLCNAVEIDSADTVAVPFYINDKSGMGIDGIIAYHSNIKVPWSGLLNLTMLNILSRGEAASLFYRGEELLQQFDLDISKYYPFLLPIFCSVSFGLEIEESSYGFLHGKLEILTQLKELWQAGIAVVGHETTTDESNSSWYFIGVDLILNRKGEPFRTGMLSREFLMQSGTGIADRHETRFKRWHIDFSGTSHIPLFKKQAFMGRIVTKAIITENRDTLHSVEKNRVGGHNSIRGYPENQYSFSIVAFIQTEYLFYFKPTGSVYILLDGGVGFPKLSYYNRTELLGYGIGIRIPVRIGKFSLEWARNINEKKGLGRIHLRISNSLSNGM